MEVERDQGVRILISCQNCIFPHPMNIHYINKNEIGPGLSGNNFKFMHSNVSEFPVACWFAEMGELSRYDCICSIYLQ